MAVVVVSPTRSSAALNNYVLNDKKDQQGERYVMASGLGGLLVSVAEKQMRDVRKKYNKDKPGAYVQAYHVIQSFGQDELEPDDPDSWLTAQKLGRALAEDRFPGRQALVVTQRDGKTGCVHNHIVVNSVETKTGRSLNSSVVTHARLVQEHDRVLAEQGFEQRADIKQTASDAKERFERGEPSRMRRKGETETRELRELQRYIVWETECDVADELGVARNTEPFSVAVLKHSITQALADPDATDWTSLVEAGREHGVDIQQRSKKGRGISYGMLREQPDGTRAEPSASDRRRCSSLGAGFEMDAVEQALAGNRAAQPTQAPATPAVAAVAHVTLPAPRDQQSTQPQPSIEENKQATKADVRAQENDKRQRRTADHMTANALDSESLDPTDTSVRLEESATVPVPGGVSLSSLRRPQEDQEGSSESFSALGEPEVDEATSKAEPAEADAERLVRINERNRRLGLPPVSAEQDAANQAMTPEQRQRQRAHSELFDDTEPIAKAGKPGQGFAD